MYHDCVQYWHCTLIVSTWTKKKQVKRVVEIELSIWHEIFFFFPPWGSEDRRRYLEVSPVKPILKKEGKQKEDIPHLFVNFIHEQRMTSWCPLRLKLRKKRGFALKLQKTCYLQMTITSNRLIFITNDKLLSYRLSHCLHCPLFSFFILFFVVEK